jgi:hypothetical protein
MTDQNTTIDRLENVIALRTPQFTDEEALAWLRERGRITASASHLARVWGWPERRTRRQLDQWKLAGLIRRKGKSISVDAAKSDTPISAKRTVSGQVRAHQTDATCVTSDTNVGHKSDVPPLVDRKGRAKALAESVLPQLLPEATPSIPLSLSAVTDRRVFDLGHIDSRADYLGAAGRLLACGLAIVGLTANATFGVSMGITIWQQVLYALLWASIDGIALWLPSMALRLWQNQHRIPAAAAWLLCAGAIYASALAANGFLSSTVGNTIAERQNLIEQKARLTKHREKLERDLASVELPHALTSDAGIATLEAAVKSKAEAREHECLRRGPICHHYENEETELRKQLADGRAARLTSGSTS